MNTSIILHEFIAQIETENMIIGNTRHFMIAQKTLSDCEQICS